MTIREVLKLCEKEDDEPVSVENIKCGEWVEKQVVYNCNIQAWQSARCPSCKKYLTTPFNYTFYDYNF